MTNTKTNGFCLHEPELRTHTAEFGGQQYTFTELNGLQRIIADEESGLTTADKDDKKAMAYAWYEYQVLVIALSLEPAAGVGYQDLVQQLKRHRLETLNAMYTAALIAIEGAEANGSPKGESA